MLTLTTSNLENPVPATSTSPSIELTVTTLFIPMSNTYFLLVIFPSMSVAQWDGKTAIAKKDVIACTSMRYMEEMYWLAEAGNTRVQERYISENKCLRFPTDMYVTVLRDVSHITDPEQAQILVEASSSESIRLWALMESLRCCYKIE